jgi:hypothetical protein
MKHSTSELHVVYSSDPYSGTSLTGDSAFTDQAEALAQRDTLNAESRRMMPNAPVNYHVTNLDDFMRMAQDDARAEGRSSRS